MKKFLSLMLALAMVLGLFACAPAADPNTSNPPVSNPVESTEPTGNPEPGEFQPMTYDDWEIYNNTYGEFYKALQEAKECVDIDEMFAKMAIAEAKFLEAAAVVPYYGDGGSWGISRLAPRTVPTVMWGSDQDRYEYALVTTELLKAEDRKHITAMWNELAGTGTYEQSVKDYLAEKGYTLKDSFAWNGYGSDPEIWDPLAAWTNTVGEPLCMTVDGLVRYDMENVLQPGLATSWEHSEDGLTWTFHLREGVQWVDSQGRKLDDVKADDWVASLQHLFDFYGDSAAEVLAPMIVNGLEYVNGDVTDFAQVGVEAVDDHTLVYHLTHAVPAFESMLTYCGFFAPLCRSYYTAQGGTFGPDHDNGDFGTSPNNIAYCGPYLITSYTAQQSIVFEANPTYWNLDKMNITKVTWPYYDGKDPTKSYDDCIAGVNDGTGLGPSALIKCKEDGNFDDYAITSTVNGTSRIGFQTLNRQIFHNFNEETAGVSPQEHGSVDTLDKANGVNVADASIIDDAARTHVAMNNQNFRLAMALGLDRAAYHAQRVGEELKLVSLRNSYVPGTFVETSKEITVDINGTPTTFPAGTKYGAMLQAAITADGYPMKVWDPELDDGVGSSDGFDGWYNVSAAREYLAKAVEELAAVGVEVSKENPIQVDYVYYGGSEAFTNLANAYKQSIESSLEGAVQVNLVNVESQEQLNYNSFLHPDGTGLNCDESWGTAWTPDYGDPASYLDVFLPGGDGYMCKNLGLGPWLSEQP